ncbi:MAG: phosphoesterase [Legionellaceae bacterium]|nr:phosphoesterase [Legionellaceae bacterium]|tara:strand:+ start:1022 stop:1474 length:453 start_codon:yes stop_codon:yes gene_type:complete
MPDLSRDESLKFWREYQDPAIYRVIAFMESVEHWTYDGNPALEEAMKRLGDSLEDITKFEVKLEEHYIKLGANIYMGRLLRLLQAIDTTHPGSASKVLMYSESNSSKHADIEFFLRRNIAFERLRLLSRVFSPERVKMLGKVLEGEDNEE